MKAKIIAYFLFLITIEGFGQITVDYEQFISVGDSIVEHYDSQPHFNITPGDEGENVTWDFQFLESDFTDTLSIVSPSKTRFSEHFSASDIALCLSSTPDVASFFNKTDDNLQYTGTGYYDQSKMVIDTQNKRSILKYPLQYLDEDYQVLKEEKILFKDSIKVLTTLEYHYKVDAWGDLKLPTGLFFALRVKRSLTITDAYYKLSGFWWEKYQEKIFPNITYEWWTDNPNAKHHIAYLVMDSSNEKVLHASFIPAIPFKEKIEQVKQNFDLTLYPNPAQSVINMNLPAGKKYANIYSFSGQLVHSETLFSEKGQINVSRFSSGLYVLVLKSDSGEIFGTSKFIKR
ncbi:MAG: T9SS type A sorting domain-containing protein [Bacteroidota bacterium]